MTAALPYINNIDALYPVPGAFNDANGFRNNFNNIEHALRSLDNYMNSLAAPPSDKNAPSIIANTVVASNTLQLGTTNFINIGSSNELKVKGFNPNGTTATGAVAFFPNVIPVAVKNISKNNSSITIFNTTTNILVGASFTPASTTTVYTVTGPPTGYIIPISPAPTFDDVEIFITNPVFKEYTVINASTVSNLITQSFEGIVTITALTDSTSTTSGALQVRGGVGVSGNVNVAGTSTVAGDINVVGNVISNSPTNTLNGLTVPGSITFTDSNNDPSPSLVMNVNTWGSFLNANGGYQLFPGGMIWMWGVTSPVSMDQTIAVTFPTLPGYATPGFPNACANAQVTTSNPQNNRSYAMVGEIVTISAQGLVVMNNESHNGGGGATPLRWFAVGY